MLAAVGIILPAESHVLLIEGQQAVIGNGHAMGIATEIAQHLQGTAESGLSVDHPVVAVQAANQLRELPGVGESGGRAGTLELLAAVEAFQASQELAAKDATQDFYG